MLELCRDRKVAGQFIGLDRTELADLLGEAEDWSPARRSVLRAEIWRYGDIEFHFADGVVYLLFSDSGDLTQADGQMVVDPWIIRKNLPQNEFESALLEESIRFESTACGFDPDLLRVVTASGATFSFNLEAREFVGAAGLVSWQVKIG